MHRHSTTVIMILLSLYILDPLLHDILDDMLLICHFTQYVFFYYWFGFIAFQRRVVAISASPQLGTSFDHMSEYQKTIFQAG